MAEVLDRPHRPDLLHYRPWRGDLSASTGRGVLVFVAVQTGLLAVIFQMPGYPKMQLLLAGLFVGLWGLVVRSRAWPITRISLSLLFRHKLFWALYALALMVFLMFFFGQYLMAWATTQLGETSVRVGGFGRANPKWLVQIFRDALKLNGSAETFRNFFWFEGYNVMIVLALAGSILVGNDLRFGSLPFYLSKPIAVRDYLIGKGLAVAVFINLFTTLPAVGLWLQYGLLEEWSYFTESAYLLAGILGYGMVLTVSLTTILLASAVWLRRTVPLIMTWTTLMLFCRLLSEALVNRLHLSPRWRLIDLWNCTVLLGSKMLQLDETRLSPRPQPDWQEAALVLGGVTLGCLVYLVVRVRGVEVVK
jgi:hypothetical protein